VGRRPGTEVRRCLPEKLGLELAHFVEPALDPPADDRRNSASTIN
jgi:hypothetical protein